MVAVRDRVEVEIVDSRKPGVALPHPAVVLRIDTQIAVVAMGTGTGRDIERVSVAAGSREAKALGLSKDTFFYRSNVLVVPVDQIRPGHGRCPPGLFVALLALMEAPA